ncbi:MAG: DUF6786 family protein [Paludibacter sp.]|nr:DUF6786 family protein [Paludibacter sp.]
MNSFSFDLNFLLSKDDNLIVLKTRTEESQLIVSPKYQGKVFTSTAAGVEGISFGYINYKAFDKTVPDEHMNAYGGENRFWIGPEGGDFSAFFEPGVKQVFDNWHTPKAIDTESWQLITHLQDRVEMKKTFHLTNTKGTNLALELTRKISILEDEEIVALTGIQLPSEIKAVGYKTNNTIINRNSFEWNENTGAVCIWILDMFPPSPDALTIIPYVETNTPDEIANTGYFGEIPKDRISFTHGNIYLKTDGKFRSKVGLKAIRTKSMAANYDPECSRLTIVTFDADIKGTYLNQEWGTGKSLFDGDVMNAYNDGPLEDGSVMGPFHELESSSPAAFIQPDEMMSHQHHVFHFTGEKKYLSEITNKFLGVTIETLECIF